MKMPVLGLGTYLVSSISKTKLFPYLIKANYKFYFCYSLKKVTASRQLKMQLMQVIVTLTPHIFMVMKKKLVLAVEQRFKRAL